MKITTPNGDSNIEEIKEKDNVVCAAGYGEAGIGVVDKVMKKKYVGPVIKVTTKTGREIKATPNHIGFAKINANPGVYYVYLMYKRGVGFRIGQTQDVRSRKGEIVSGLYVRLNQEHADKMWILKVCNNKAEASYYEQFFAFRYGIPTTVFETTGRKMSMTQEYINKIFNEINTQEAASRLMEDNMIFEEYPHHICNAVIKGQSTRRIVNICSFGGKRYQGTNCCSHRIALITSGDELKKSAQENDFPVRDGQRDTWRIETERKDYDEAVLYAKKIAQIDNDLEIVKKARLTEEKSFDYMHLHI
nr:Hint domain-containing protein [Fervidicella metallireducens]